MAVVVCCPCGNPLDYDQLELVVTITCPLCKQELTLELEDAAGRSRRAFLTVMEGPLWVGEKFVVPVGLELRIGRATGNWLAMDHDSLAEVHGRMHLQADGTVILEDGKSPTGTWVGKHRIARGKLSSRQSFRMGDFRFRFDLRSSDGATLTAAAQDGSPSGVLDKSGILPVMREVQDRRNPLRWFSVNRFIVARWFMMGFAILMGLYHFLHVQRHTASERAMLHASLSGAGVLALLLLAGQRVTLVHRHLKYGALAMLILLAVADMLWAMPIPAIGCLLMAACMTALILRVPSGGLALAGTTVGLCAVTVLLAGGFIASKFAKAGG